MVGRTAQQRIGPTEDLDLVFDLSNPAFGFMPFAGLRARDTLDLTAVYPILLHSAIQAGIGNLQVLGCLRIRLP